MQRTLAVSLRVAQQLRRDARTVLLLLVVPSALLALLRWVFDGQEQVFQRVGVPLLGVFPLLMLFLVGSITMLRERTSGTLERLMTMPLARADLVAGYALAFAALALLQVSVTAAVAFMLLGLDAEGPIVLIVVLALLNALLGVSVGLFVSAFARTEFQAVQFMPVFILPQFLLCGLLTARSSMAPPLEWVSYALPMSYSYEALSLVAAGDTGDSRLLRDVAFILAFGLAALAAGSATLPRRTD